MARHSGFGDRGPFGNTIVEQHSWRRGQDRGKGRLTHGIYGTENDIRAAFKKDNEIFLEYHWNRFRNGKFMVW